MVAFESPHRLRASLEDIEREMGPDRPLVVCRELTKLYEEIVRGDASEIRGHFEDIEPRGEVTLVIGGGSAVWDEGEVRKAMKEQLARGVKRSKAAQSVAAEAGWPRSEVYQLVGDEE